MQIMLVETADLGEVEEVRAMEAAVWGVAGWEGTVGLVVEKRDMQAAVVELH